MTFTASQSSLPPLPGTQRERLALNRARADVKALERARRIMGEQEIPGVGAARLASTVLALTQALNFATELRDELERRLHSATAGPQRVPVTTWVDHTSATRTTL